MEEYVSTRDANFVVPPHQMTEAFNALKTAPVDRLDLAGDTATAALPEPGSPIPDQRSQFEALPDHVRAAATIRHVSGDGPLTGREWDIAEWPVFVVLDADRLHSATTLVAALDAWGWASTAGSDGSVAIDSYAAGSSYGDSDAALAILAHYVEPGSYVHLRGDDGDWRWIVSDNHVLVEQVGRVVFDAAPTESVRQ